MAVLTQRFDEAVERGAAGGHGHFRTVVVVGAGGFEDRNQEWEDARGRWNVGRAIEATGQHEEARRLFYKARGQLHDFRFRDWNDFQCARTGDDKGRLTGSGTAWQANKVYGADEPSYEYVRPLYRIESGSDQIWRNGALQARGADYTIDVDTGVVTSAISWTGATLEFACRFDVLCHFEFDEFTARAIYRRSDADLLFKWDDIRIVETREGTPA